MDVGLVKIAVLVSTIFGQPVGVVTIPDVKDFASAEECKTYLETPEFKEKMRLIDGMMHQTRPLPQLLYTIKCVKPKEETT